ncbi:undecaprenyl-phosphate glucose phosphotransferase [Pontibacter burrus]|uniref:Undecaprenyl-phosphate glucose phosphotransferase n=1 Tax=Pontibacter burrus TaxID=2704466 RepID=A0A6B3LWB7_9BACT|nr:undecaprenyl-phosphate glucose phosphotransferase [Pontibacter burrus]NEM97734.1 undecaprenyl-phosphate glucose phosphotransferase [Pontibacter burrus]
MVHKYATLFRWLNIIVDYMLLNGMFYISFLIAEYPLVWVDVYDYKLTLLLLNFCWFYSSSVFNIYSHILKRDSVPIINSNIAALTIFIIIAAIIKLVLPDLYVPPTPFIYYFALFPTLVLAWRFMFLLLRKYRRKVWLRSSYIVIVGAGSAGTELYNYVCSNPQLECYVAGMFDDNPNRVPPNINYLGRVDQCISYAVENNVNEIYCTLPNNDCERIEKLLLETDRNMIRFRLVPDLKGSIHHNFMVDMFGYVPVLKPRQEPLENKANEIVKRIFDILFSLIVIVFVLSWLTPILAALIKIESKGPVFFKQLRSGKNNKPFFCLKFRSMKVNPDLENEQATKNDYRVTRVGRFIRMTSIDELPQFINVLLGHMSVVGPRPHMLKQTLDYSELINNYMVRHFLTPGITGWAQVNGYRGETKETSSMINRVKADLWYLENWSILLDIKIIFLTIWKLLKYDKNAY